MVVMRSGSSASNCFNRDVILVTAPTIRLYLSVAAVTAVTCADGRKASQSGGVRRSQRWMDVLSSAHVLCLIDLEYSSLRCMWYRRSMRISRTFYSAHSTSARSGQAEWSVRKQQTGHALRQGSTDGARWRRNDGVRLT